MNTNIYKYDEEATSILQEAIPFGTSKFLNLDMICQHKKLGFIVIELLLCDEKQPSATPYTSHPRRYWNKTKNKFLQLWRIAQALKGKLYLINYAKKGTKNENEVLLIEVLDMCDTGIIKETSTTMTRNEFLLFLKDINNECGLK